MTSTAPTPTELDRNALRERYRNERDKRLRSDGNDQRPDRGYAAPSSWTRGP